MRARRCLLALGLSLARAAEGAAADRILFVGNSLTAWNDLPLVVEAMAKEKGVSLSCEAATRPDFSLEDHWKSDALSMIRRGGFKYVVLQQGPSSLPASRENLREWAKRFGDEVRRAGATPALFMVWPDRSRLAVFPEVRESYRLAAEEAGGVLLPAGDAWLAAWQRDEKLGLYGPDNFHPSRLGTYAAAAAIVSGLTGASPAGLPARLRLRNGDDYRIDEREARIVLEAAAEVAPRPRP